MKTPLTLCLLAGAALLLPGCVRTVAGVVTAPVKATGKVVDWSTTSKEEADRNRGKKLRKQCKEHYDPQYCDNN